jgi:hypothetical protein
MKKRTESSEDKLASMREKHKKDLEVLTALQKEYNDEKSKKTLDMESEKTLTEAISTAEKAVIADKKNINEELDKRAKKQAEIARTQEKINQAYFVAKQKLEGKEVTKSDEIKFDIAGLERRLQVEKDIWEIKKLQTQIMVKQYALMGEEQKAVEEAEKKSWKEFEEAWKKLEEEEKKKEKAEERKIKLADDFAKTMRNNQLELLRSQRELARSTNDWMDGLEGVAGKIANVSKSMMKFRYDEISAREAQTKLDNRYANQKAKYTKKFGKDSKELAELEQQYTKSTAVIKEQASQNEIQAYSQVAGALGKMFEEGSAGAAAMQVAQATLGLASAYASIANAASAGDPYSAPARVAIMAAAMAPMISSLMSLGAATSGGGGAPVPTRSATSGTYANNQGLDANNPALSSSMQAYNNREITSIADSLSILEEYADPQYRVLEKMYRSMSDLNRSIEGLAIAAFKTGGGDLSKADLSYSQPDRSKLLAGFLTGGPLGASVGILGVADAWGNAVDSITNEIDKLLGGVDGGIIGGAVNAIFGGWANDVVDGLLGGKVKSKDLKDYGVKFNEQIVTSALDTISGNMYQTIETKTEKAFWQGTDTASSEILKPLDEQFAADITKVRDKVWESTIDAAVALGYQYEDVARDLDGNIMKAFTVSLNQSEEEINKQLTELFSGFSEQLAIDALNGLLDPYRNPGEEFSTAINRVAAETTVALKALSLTGVELENTVERTYSSFDGLEIATGIENKAITITQSLIELSGGLDKFLEAQSTYYDNYFTDAEKFDNTQGMLNARFAELNISAPKTYEEFRGIVESLDLTTEAGRKAYVDVMAVADAFTVVGDKAEKIADEEASLQQTLDLLTGVTTQRELELAALHPSNRSLQERAWLLEDEKRLNGILFDMTATEQEKREEILKTLAPSNQLLQKRIWLLEDEEKRLQESNRTQEEYIRGIQQANDNIFNEAQRLINTLFNMYATDAQKRAKILEELNPANRIYQEQIFLLEDLQKAEKDALDVKRKALDDWSKALNDYVSEISKSISTLEGVFSSVTKTIESLREPAKTAEVRLQDFYDAMSAANKADIKNTELYSKLIQKAIETSSTLFDTANFAEKRDMDFAQLVAANQFEGLEDALNTEIDYLKQIEINTRTQIEVLATAMNDATTDMSVTLASFAAQSTSIAKAQAEALAASAAASQTQLATIVAQQQAAQVVASAPTAPTTVTTASAMMDLVNSIYTKYDLHRFQTDDSGYKYWESQLLSGSQNMSSIDEAIRVAAMLNNHIQSTVIAVDELSAAIAALNATSWGAGGSISFDGTSARMSLASGASATMSSISALRSAYGFSSGGYTGHGGKFDPAGIVHRGEFVVDKDNTAKLGLNQNMGNVFTEMLKEMKLIKKENEEMKKILLSSNKYQDNIERNTKTSMFVGVA